MQQAGGRHQAAMGQSRRQARVRRWRPAAHTDADTSAALPKAIPSGDDWARRMTPAGAPTRVRRKRSGTWPIGIAMSVAGATVGE